MKHNNKLKITLSVILTIILCLTLASCKDSKNESVSTDDIKAENTSATETTANSETDSTEETTEISETENNEPYEIKVDDYTLIKNETGCYLTFDDILKYQNSSSGGAVLAKVEFASIKDFKDMVTKGLLSDDDKSTVASFSQNADGSIQTCDFNNLYEPILPQGSKITSVSWEADTYSFRLKMDGVYKGYCMVLTEEDYEQLYTDQYLNDLNKDTITITETVTIDGKEIIYYKTPMATVRLERFTLQSEGKTLIIDKEFILTGNALLNPSDTIPNNINIFCNEGNKYFKIYIGTIYEDPTDEWLLQFGLKRYVENDHEVM